MESLTHEEASNLLSYDKDTGSLTWRAKRRPSIKAGDPAGCRSIVNGYIDVCVNGRFYKAHRIAWLLVTGSFPKLQIDHLNGIRDDNRWKNLREVDNTTNQENQRLPRRDSSTGLKGISPNGKGFKAYIRVGGIRQHLGTYKTATEAHEVYLTAKRQFHKGNTL